MKYPKFFEYMNARGGTDTKAKVDVTGDQLDMPKKDPHKKQSKKNKKAPQVKEYLNSGGKLVEKPLVDIKADYKGPDPSSPPGKNSTPYRAANSGMGNKSNSESGLGDMGYKNLKYNPNTNTETGEKTVSTFPKTKTEHFIAETQHMTTGEFAQHMIENHGCKHVDFIKAVQYVAELANHNDSLMGNFVHEVKGTGGIGKLLRTILTQPEAFDELQELFGEKRAKSLRRTMNKSILEGVSAPIGGGEEDELGGDEDMEMSDMDDDMEDEGFDDADIEGLGNEEEQLCPHCGMDINDPPEDDLEDEEGELGGDFPLGDEEGDDEMKLGDEDFEGEPDLDDDDMDMGDEDMDMDDDDMDMDDDDMDMDDDDMDMGDEDMDMDDDDMDMDDDDMDDEDDDIDPDAEIPKRKKKFRSMLDGDGEIPKRKKKFRSMLDGAMGKR